MGSIAEPFALPRSRQLGVGQVRLRQGLRPQELRQLRQLLQVRAEGPLDGWVSGAAEPERVYYDLRLYFGGGPRPVANTRGSATAVVNELQGAREKAATWHVRPRGTSWRERAPAARARGGPSAGKQDRRIASRPSSRDADNAPDPLYADAGLQRAARGGGVEADRVRQQRPLGSQQRPPVDLAPRRVRDRDDAHRESGRLDARRLLVWLTANPGVWTRDDFLSGEEVARVLDALPPTNATCPEGLTGNFDATCWGRCKGAAHDKQVGKVCSVLETKKYPWLTDRMLGVWDSGDVREKPDTFDVMRYQKHAEPTHAHRDRMSGGGYASASMPVFLTGGDVNDAALHFPNTPGSALKIHPKRGLSAAWLNALPCGKSSFEGVHGVEAAPESATGDRIVLFTSTNSSVSCLIAAES